MRVIFLSLWVRRVIFLIVKSLYGWDKATVQQQRLGTSRNEEDCLRMTLCVAYRRSPASAGMGDLRHNASHMPTPLPQRAYQHKPLSRCITTWVDKACSQW